MPLSHRNIALVNTLEILSVASEFNYTFDCQSNNTVQILWADMVSASDATVGTRTIALTLFDELGTQVFRVRYFKTHAAGSALQVLFMQGSTVIPQTVLGLNTTLPFDGLFARDKYLMNIKDLNNTSVGDVITGMWQTRGLHNSDAQ